MSDVTCEHLVCKGKENANCSIACEVPFDTTPDGESHWYDANKTSHASGLHWDPSDICGCPFDSELGMRGGRGVMVSPGDSGAKGTIKVYVTDWSSVYSGVNW